MRLLKKIFFMIYSIFKRDQGFQVTPIEQIVCSCGSVYIATGKYKGTSMEMITNHSNCDLGTVILFNNNATLDEYLWARNFYGRIQLKGEIEYACVIYNNSIYYQTLRFQNVRGRLFYEYFKKGDPSDVMFFSTYNNHPSKKKRSRVRR